MIKPKWKNKKLKKSVCGKNKKTFWNQTQQQKTNERDEYIVCLLDNLNKEGT